MDMNDVKVEEQEEKKETVALSDWMTLKEAAKRIKMANGKRPSYGQLYRWCAYGQSGIKLKHGRQGKSYLITEQYLSDFFRELGEADDRRITEEVHGQWRRRFVVSAKRQRELDACMERCRQKGLA